MQYLDFLRQYVALMHAADQIPLGGYKAKPWPRQNADAKTVLIISAHPDDEILMGMPLGIRFRKAGWRVINLAVTIGRPEQYERRRAELKAACDHLGMDFIIPGKTGLRDEIKSGKKSDWENAVEYIARQIRHFDPEVIITHHDQDSHHDHIATHKLTLEAMRRNKKFDCVFIEGEYWQDMSSPNVQVELGIDDFAVLLEALSFHKGELARNRYDKFWPPYAHVNARYSEIIMGWATPASTFDFSVMYRVRRYRKGKFEKLLEPLQLSASTPIEILLPKEWR